MGENMGPTAGSMRQRAGARLQGNGSGGAAPGNAVVETVAPAVAPVEPQEMRAAQFTGGSALEVVIASRPTRLPGHCLVRVHAAGLNPTDIKHLSSEHTLDLAPLQSTTAAASSCRHGMD